MKRREIYNQIRKYEEWNERIENLVCFINQRIGEGKSPETALMQLQIDLRNCIRTKPAEKLRCLCEEVDKKIIYFHDGKSSIIEVGFAIGQFQLRFKKEAIAQRDKLQRLLNLYDAIIAMLFANDECPEFILQEKLVDALDVTE